MRKISGLFGALTLLVALTSCGGDSTSPGGGGGGGGGVGNCAAATFCMGSSTFVSATGSAASPTVTVATNTAVSWNNNSGGITHDVTFDAPAAALAVGNGSAGDIPQHSSGINQRQFATAGSYPFHCTIHGAGMKGTVIVQ
jgi:plastocyanin